MEKIKILTILVFSVGLLVWSGVVSIAEPMGTGFTYQGLLKDKNKPADGPYDFQFNLYDGNDPCNATLLGTNDINEVNVFDGHLVVELDFGSDVFDGNAVWLETKIVRSPMGSDPAALRPLMELTPAPYAIYTKKPHADNEWMVVGDDMYSIPSGNVGIGTEPGGNKLKVAGNIDATGFTESGSSTLNNDISGNADTATNADKVDGKHAADLVKIGDAAGGDLAGTYPNPTIADGAVTNNKFEQHTPSDTEFFEIGQGLVDCSTYKLRYGMRVVRGGTIRVKFEMGHMRADGTVYARIYVNGAAVGTERIVTGSHKEFSEDISVNAGDTIEIYSYVSQGPYAVISWFTLCSTLTYTPASGVDLVTAGDAYSAATDIPGIYVPAARRLLDGLFGVNKAINKAFIWADGDFRVFANW